MALTTTEEALVRQLLDQQAAILSLADAESTIISKLGATKVTIADLTSASAIDDADLFLIRQGTTEKNVSGAVVKALASASVAGATETSAGIVELATSAEVQTGTDTSRAITPAGLSSRAASETLAGLLEIATAAEAQAFTANKAIDGAKLAAALQGANQSLSANGYQKLPGGLIIQWGAVASVGVDTTISITFPMTFPNYCLKVIPTKKTDGTNDDVMASIVSYTTTGATFRSEQLNNALSAGGRTIEYFAIGY